MIWENLLQVFTRRDSRGRRRLRVWVYPVLTVCFLAGGLAGCTARSAQESAAPTPPAASPTGFFAARLSGCPADPGSFSLADPDYGEGAVFASLRAEGRSRLDPPCARWGLVRSLAFFVLTANGWTGEEARDALGLPYIPYDPDRLRGSYVAIALTPGMRVWKGDAEVWALRGCGRLPDGALACVVTRGALPGPVAYRIGDLAGRVEYSGAGADIVVFTYSGGHVWDFAGPLFLADGRQADEDYPNPEALRAILQASAAAYGAPAVDMRWIRENLGLEPKPAPAESELTASQDSLGKAFQEAGSERERVLDEIRQRRRAYAESLAGR